MIVEKAAQSLLNQGVIAQAAEAVTEPISTVANAFDAVLGRILGTDSAKQVNEEELFAATIYERISTLKGEDVANEYQSKLEQNKQNMMRSDGYVPVEDAARKALNDMVSDSKLTSEEAKSIHAQSFAAAQLDDNLDALYDGRGSANDPTIAVAAMESALINARARIEKFDEGSEDAGLLDLGLGNTGSGDVTGGTGSISDSGDSSIITPEGNSIDGDGGFVFKPVSDSDGNLVVLLPAQFTNDVSSLLLKDKDGNEIEEGNSVGPTNGDRETYRFNKPGADYQKDLVVEVTLKDGTVKEYHIANPGERYD